MPLSPFEAVPYASTMDIYQHVLRSSVDEAADAISASQDTLLMNKAPKKKAA